jgi:hypothetical protein
MFRGGGGVDKKNWINAFFGVWGCLCIEEKTTRFSLTWRGFMTELVGKILPGPGGSAKSGSMGVGECGGEGGSEGGVWGVRGEWGSEGECGGEGGSTLRH